MADLGFSVTRAKSMFEGAPCVLHRSDDEALLKALQRQLDAAGADVLVRHRREVPEAKNTNATRVTPNCGRTTKQIKPVTHVNGFDTAVSDDELNYFFEQLTRCQLINPKRFRIVDGVKTEEPESTICRHDSQY
jgi:hypothetical protein